MSPFLKDGKVLFCSKNTDDLKRGSVVVFRFEGSNKYFVKRIVGLPGEEIEIADGILLINGYFNEINKLFALPLNTTNELNDWVLGKDQYFVIGDNLLNSNDSRNYGPINKTYITSRMILKIW
jgi:signal peptidase I